MNETQITEAWVCYPRKEIRKMVTCFYGIVGWLPWWVGFPGGSDSSIRKVGQIHQTLTDTFFVLG